MNRNQTAWSTKTGRARRARGMTLIELLLAVAGTALVAAAIAAMLVATSYGTESRTDMRELIVKHKAISTRLSAAIRSARMVLEQGDGYIVLWLADTNEDGQPNLAELRRLERHGATNALRSYIAPADLDETDNTAYDLDTTDFGTETDSIKGSANFPEALWATDVTGWDLTLDDADARLARLVTWRLALRAGDMTDTAVGVAALRNE